MKSKILYALVGALFSLAIVGFWGFKTKQEEGSKYVVVSTDPMSSEIWYASENGDFSTEVYEKRNYKEGRLMAHILEKMDTQGYDLNGINGFSYVFKKR